jgi:hypothetical protein
MSAGVFLRIIQYGSGRSLWEDEAKLALNIIDRGYVELMLPLRFYQVAPLPFLWIERFFYSLIPNPDYALRLFPLLCGIGMLWPLWYVARKISGNESAALWALALAAFNPFSMYYASEIKQYSTDLLWAVVLPALYFRAETLNKKARIGILGLGGVAALFFSYVAVIVLFSLGIHRLWLWYRSKKIEWDYFYVFVIWAVAFGINYFAFIHGHNSRNFILDALGDHFMPLNFWSPDFMKWMGFHLGWIFTKTLHFPKTLGLWVIFLGLFLWGIFYTARQKQYTPLLMCLLPVAVHFMLSALKMYPVAPRLVYYLMPCLLIPIGIGLNFMTEFLREKRLRLYIIPVLMAPLFIGWVIQIPVYNEELKPALKYMEGHHVPGDKIYLYCGAVNTFEYYQKTGFFTAKAEIISGGLYRENPENYINEVSSVGAPLWLVFQHVYPFNKKPDEEDLILEYLTKEYRITDKQLYQKASVYRMVEQDKLN